MPWTPRDASAKTKRADTPAKKQQWAKTADAVLARTGDDGQAIRVANAAVANHPSRKTPPKHWSAK